MRLKTMAFQSSGPHGGCWSKHSSTSWFISSQSPAKLVVRKTNKTIPNPFSVFPTFYLSLQCFRFDVNFDLSTRHQNFCLRLWYILVQIIPQRKGVRLFFCRLSKVQRIPSRRRPSAPSVLHGFPFLHGVLHPAMVFSFPGHHTKSSRETRNALANAFMAEREPCFLPFSISEI